MDPSSSRSVPLPPGGRGLPFVGETLEFVRDPRMFIERRRARYGEVFTSRVFGMHLVSLTGAEVNRWIFSNDEKIMRNKWIGGVRRLLGADCVSVLVGEAHRARRRVLAPHFRRAGMEPLLEPIATVVREHLQRWAESDDESLAVSRFKHMAFEIAIRYIFGDVSAIDLPKLSRDFDCWVEGMFTGISLRIPGTAFGRAMAARTRIFATIEAEVQRRIMRSRPGDDVLSTLLCVRDEQGQLLSRSTIVDEVQVLLFAGHDTTVSALTNLMLHLTQHPEVLARARAEQDAADERLTLEGLRSMPYLEAVINESMRLVPPVAGSFRELTTDVKYAGFQLLRGWSVQVSPVGVHQDESLWTEPERFDPERWLPERAEHRRHPFGFIPFGGGPRRCIGEHFAMLEMQIVVALMLRDYEWTLTPGQDLQLRLIPFPRPRDGLRVRVSARA